MNRQGKSDKASPKVTVKASSWWMVSVLFMLYVFSWLDRMILSMLVGPIKADLILSDFQVGLLLGPAFALFYALFGMPLGWAVDRYKRRWIIFGGVSLWASATIASGFAQTFPQLMFARVCVGIGEAALLPAAYSLLADEFPRERLTTATSVFQMAGKVGSAAAFGIGGLALTFAVGLQWGGIPFISTAEPWQIVFWLVGLPGLALAFFVFTFREPPRRNLASNTLVDVQTEKASAFQFIRQNLKLVLIIVSTFSCLAICGYTLTSWVPTYISRHFHWEPIQYGPALSIMNLIGAASLVINGRLVDHLFTRGMRDVHLRFYSWLMLGTAPFVIILFLTQNVYIFLACYAVSQFVTVPFMVYVSAIVSLLAPNAVRGQLIAMFLFVATILGLGAGPTIVGALTDFVFRSEGQLGLSLMVTVLVFFSLAFLGMRLGLLRLSAAIERLEADAVPNGPAT